MGVNGEKGNLEMEGDTDDQKVKMSPFNILFPQSGPTHCHHILFSGISESHKAQSQSAIDRLHN